MSRKKKNKQAKYSTLDKIYGLGPAKKKRLLRYFKSLQAIRAASLDELCKVNGISIKLAESINKNL
jgi:excinuclease ABC subunit C